MEMHPKSKNLQHGHKKEPVEFKNEKKTPKKEKSWIMLQNYLKKLLEGKEERQS